MATGPIPGSSPDEKVFQEIAKGERDWQKTKVPSEIHARHKKLLHAADRAVKAYNERAGMDPFAALYNLQSVLDEELRCPRCGGTGRCD